MTLRLVSAGSIAREAWSARIADADGNELGRCPHIHPDSGSALACAERMLQAVTAAAVRIR